MRIGLAKTKEWMVTIQRIKKESKKWNFLSCKADNCASVLKYSVRDCKDNNAFESSKLFQKFFSYFFYLYCVMIQEILQCGNSELVIIRLPIDENHIK